MKRRRSAVAVLLVVTTVLLQGCDQLKALFAFGGLGVGAALQARPDRSLSYEIEVVTDDGSTLRFAGSTYCSHRVNINDYRGRYATASPTSTLRRGDEVWMLTGIDCDNEIVERKPGRYVLYRVIDERLARAYFVVPDGPARVSKATFDSTTFASSKESRATTFTYSAGPYQYQKVFFSTPPRGVKDHVDPIVVFEGANTCGRQNTAGVSLSKEEFFEQFRRGTGMVAVEEGVLAYQHATDAWSPIEGADPSKPMDATAYSPIAVQKLDFGCVRLHFNGHTFVVSESANGSVLYIPAEKAFYRVARTWYGAAQTYLEEKRQWSVCAVPRESRDYRPGVMYISPGFQVAKKVDGGGVMCRGSFRWL